MPIENDIPEETGDRHSKSKYENASVHTSRCVLIHCLLRRRG